MVSFFKIILDKKAYGGEDGKEKQKKKMGKIPA